jgi:uncharacterized delta-60 repeat protein
VIPWQGPGLAVRVAHFAGCCALLSLAACAVAAHAARGTAAAAHAAAVPGAFDPSFGESGTGYSALPLGAWAAATAVRVQPDGKIVTAGEAQLAGGARVMVSTRTNPDGSPDPSYGSDGVVTVDVGGEAGANAVALQPDGKIVLAGEGDAGAMVFAAARLEPDGTLDRTFGAGGIVTVPIGSAAMANAVQLQSDGKVVLGGTASIGHNEFAAARLNPDGSLDRSFGSGGTATLPATAAAWAMALQPDGKIVLAGQESSFGTQVYMAARLLAGGAADWSFGIAGMVGVPIGTSAYGDALALQPDGKIVLGGSAYTSTSVAAAVRLTPGGWLDRAFGSGGIATVPDWYGINAATLQPSDGRILLAGTGASLVRLNADGSADTTLGAGGVDLLRIGGSGDAANGIAIEPSDGKIILAGVADISGRLEPIVIRLTP